MLTTLRIKNFAIVENIIVEYGNGLNVITGETGAGKSILAAALGLVLGERADKTMIRAGDEQCGVEAVFQLADPLEINNILAEMGIDACEDGRLIVRRIITTSGSGKNLINDCPTTVQALNKIGDLLVDMHGPHDHQSLLSQEFQLDLLDSFGHLEKIREAYQIIYRELCELKARRKELDCDDTEVARQIEMLSFQVKEIEDANLTSSDETDLENEHKITANAQRILELSNGIRTALSDSDSSAFNALSSIQAALNELTNLLPEAVEWKKEAESISIQIQELTTSISSRVQNIESDTERLQWLEDRMAMLHKFKRKYGASVKEILEHLNKSKERLSDLQSRGEKISEIDRQIEAIQKEIQSAGGKLGKERRTAAETMAKAITRELRDLGFKQGSFSVELRQIEPGPSGMDETDFGFAPNVGEPARPLRAIASSGEISRVMLAIKSVLANHDRIPVLVFDEIDSNVGGEMGNAIGAKLSVVAEKHQVLCITHLPQVAVHGTTHFVVAKEVRGGRTCTGIKGIKGDDRVEEIARMLGGRDLTSVTLKHAKEMLKKGSE
ncbi:MAG: DNA repair protein RecN [Kiritimatiellae bacterium]|nr:DNA repair protein RecN [Kiritimatiellia bacterium]MDD5521663.1 DNA repair protein RecN [Kiritimatiellia bacterium]